MIDVIIPAYNAHDTICQALASLAVQSIKNKIKVYIVNDGSSKNYNREVEIFNNSLDIEELSYKNNMGPGYARQYGIDHSTAEFIVFLDADDLLYSCFSLEILYKYMVVQNFDIVAGSYIDENNKQDDMHVVRENEVFGCLHGKIYRRSNLEKKNIRFNYTRYSEDNSFGGLVINTTKKYLVIDDIIYVYRNNKKSLTNSDNIVMRHTCYLHNILWLVRELEKREVSQDIINNIILNCYIYIFHEVLENPEVDFSKMYRDCFMYEEYYERVADMIREYDLYNAFYYHFYKEKKTIDIAMKLFLEFRNKFRRSKLND